VVSSRSGWTAPTDQGRARSGSRFVIPPASQCSVSAAKGGINDRQGGSRDMEWHEHCLVTDACPWAIPPPLGRHIWRPFFSSSHLMKLRFENRRPGPRTCSRGWCLIEPFADRSALSCLRSRPRCRANRTRAVDMATLRERRLSPNARRALDLLANKSVRRQRGSPGARSRIQPRDDRRPYPRWVGAAVSHATKSRWQSDGGRPCADYRGRPARDRGAG
jgi:hypothetical protein